MLLLPRQIAAAGGHVAVAAALEHGDDALGCEEVIQLLTKGCLRAPTSSSARLLLARCAAPGGAGRRSP